jgi:hypothetical protein
VHEKRKQRASQMNMVVYVVASALFIGIMLLSNGLDEHRGGKGGAGGEGGESQERLVPPKTRPAVNRTGATVELLKLQQARGNKLQDRMLRHKSSTVFSLVPL